MGTLEYLLIIGGFIGLVVVVIALKYPVYALQKKFTKYEISLSNEEAKKLSNFYELEDDFLSEVKEIVKLESDVSIVSLADFHRIHGGFGKLKYAMTEVKESKQSIPINSIILLLMTDKSISKALKLVGKTYKLEIKKLEEDGFSVDYKAEFKIAYEQSLWLENDLSLLEKTIKSSISLCIVSTENKTIKVLEETIINDYLNESFWMNNASGIVIEYEIKVVSCEF